jgi:hypothetical protein
MVLVPVASVVLPVRDLPVLATLSREASATAATPADSAMRRVPVLVLPLSRDRLVLATLSREASATAATPADSAMPSKRVCV